MGTIEKQIRLSKEKSLKFEAFCRVCCFSLTFCEALLRQIVGEGELAGLGDNQIRGLQNGLALGELDHRFTHIHVLNVFNLCRERCFDALVLGGCALDHAHLVTELRFKLREIRQAGV